MKRLFLFLTFTAVVLLLGSCISGNQAFTRANTITYDLVCNARPEMRFNELSHGLYIVVNSQVADENIVDRSELNSAQRASTSFQKFNFTPTIREFVSESLITFSRSCGINVGRDVKNDYTLKVTVAEFKLTAGFTGQTRATVVLDYDLYDSENHLILQQTARGRMTSSAQIGKTDFVDPLNKAFDQAVNNIDWNGIANALKVHKQAADEPTRSVQGDGHTALEHTVIRWYVISSPAGADVSWRVVSSTPDVKNTNSTYVGTTPYESTESFDIKGLSWENSGNVQIEVTCERPGYLPQRRRFNLRQAIEQKEISAKFNLVKED